MTSRGSDAAPTLQASSILERPLSLDTSRLPTTSLNETSLSAREPRESSGQSGIVRRMQQLQEEAEALRRRNEQLEGELRVLRSSPRESARASPADEALRDEERRRMARLEEQLQEANRKLARCVCGGQPNAALFSPASAISSPVPPLTGLSSASRLGPYHSSAGITSYSARYAPLNHDDPRPPPTPRLAGIGVGLAADLTTGRPFITHILQGLPAARCGQLEVGDEVVRINGRGVEGQSVDELGKVIPGEAGTSIVLTLRRPGRGDFFVVLTREVQPDHTPGQIIGAPAPDTKFDSFTRPLKSFWGRIVRS